MGSIAILDVDIGGRCPACSDSIYGYNPKCSERKHGRKCGCPGPTAKQRAEHRDKMMEVCACGIQRLYHSNWPCVGARDGCD